jgi:hypothetical protein
MVIIVEHKVRGFDAWKPVFDEHGEVRRRFDATGHTLYRDVDDPNQITVATSFPSREQGQAFAADPSLREAMERGGVIGEPRITWVEEMEKVDY